MKQAAVVIGLGEMGSVFARGLLKLGHPVYPVTRQTDINALAEHIPQPAIVLNAVAEADLHPSLDKLPAAWQNKVALLQNELLPRDWLSHKLENPTVISVWFEKKKGMDSKVLISSPAYGPGAAILVNALATLDIPAHVVPSADDMEYELVRKNVYILTTNIAGLECGGVVDELWNDHQQLAQDVANDVMDIQEWLTGKKVDRDRLMVGFKEGIDGDPQHKCMGRSAPARLKRALELADEARLTVKKLREIYSRSS
ncbi:MAG: hypothetical protein OEZ47_06625 [Gammaproteobacteria bacterium]|nr:hypothetical protein [Gammaproteobacteria bacterium]